MNTPGDPGKEAPYLACVYTYMVALLFLQGCLCCAMLSTDSCWLMLGGMQYLLKPQSALGILYRETSTNQCPKLFMQEGAWITHGRRPVASRCLCPGQQGISSCCYRRTRQQGGTRRGYIYIYIHIYIYGTPPIDLGFCCASCPETNSFHEFGSKNLEDCW